MTLIGMEKTYYVKIALSQFPLCVDNLVDLTVGSQNWSNRDFAIDGLFENMSGIDSYSISEYEFDESSKDPALYIEFDKNHFSERHIKNYGNYLEALKGLLILGDMTSSITSIQFYEVSRSQKLIEH